MPMPIWEIISIILVSTSKFIIGAAWCFVNNLTFLHSLVLTTTGGLLGTIGYTWLGDAIKSKIAKKNPKIFSRKNRFLAKLREGYGLFGVAFLTPLVLSIPVGCILALTFEKDKFRIARYVVISIILWGVLIFGVKSVLGIDLTKVLKL